MIGKSIVQSVIKIHLDSVTKLRWQKSGGLQRIYCEKIRFSGMKIWRSNTILFRPHWKTVRGNIYHDTRNSWPIPLVNC